VHPVNVDHNNFRENHHLCKKLKNYPSSFFLIFKNGNWNPAGIDKFLDSLFYNVTPVTLRPSPSATHIYS